MTEVQKYLLKLVKEIDEICIANDIEYYIFAGSMLGLERNEGFLPWDDDIDLIMTEKNYRKFIQVMRETPPPNRVFECREDNSEYPLQFGKYMSTDMTGLIRPHAFGNAASGLWIDIIHVTPAPTSARKMNFIKRWFSCYCELDNEIYIEQMNHYDGFYRRYRFCLFLASVFGKKRVDKWAVKLFNSYPEDKCEQYLMYHSLYTDYRFFDKKYFEKPVRQIYEDMELNVCPYNRDFCRVLFGDSWMMVPQIDARQVHTMVVDFDIPYYKYVNDYMPFLNKEEILKNLKETKILQFKNIVGRKRYIRRSSWLKGLLLNERMKAFVAEEGLDLKAALENMNTELLNSVYEDYEELQFDEMVSYWGAFIPIDDELLYPYLKKLICFDGEYYKANKLINLRTTSVKKPLSEELNSLRPLIDVCRSLSVALWDKQDMAELKNIINAEIKEKEYGFCIDFELAELYLRMYEASCSEDYEEIRKDVQAILDVSPKQGECMKLLGDIEYETGNIDNAMSYYNEAETLTSNGLLLLDIRKKKEAYCNGNL